jgi:DNA-binding LytR/AlgR family response regulator
MFSFLGKPYPRAHNPKKNLFVSLCIGLFVSFFLIFFEPFDISLWQDPNKNLKLFGFGAISFVIPVLINLLVNLLPVAEREDRWTVWKEIVSIAVVILCIAGGNLVYSSFIGITDISLKGYVSSLVVVLSLGIFPIGFGVLARHNRFLALSQKTALEINNRLEEKPTPVSDPLPPPAGTLKLVAENEKDKLELDWQQLLYIESADNYSVAHYLENEVVSKTMIRGSLKRMEQQCASYPTLMRCHRAFIVNTFNIIHVEGNASGYKLSLKNTQALIPVSRNYGAAITQKLKIKPE